MTVHFVWFVAAVMGILAVAVLGRLISGPTVSDRAVALDTFNTFVVGIMLLLAVGYDSVVMVDVAIVYAALSFVGTMFIARYIEGGEWQGKAGAYAIQGAAQTFISHLSGSHSGVMGLPLFETARLLRQCGVHG